MPWSPDYLTLSQVKAYLELADTLDDAQLSLWVTAASRAVDKLANRQFGQLAAPAARVYRRPAFYVPELAMWCLDVDDVQDSTGLTVQQYGGTALAYASSGATLLPDNAPPDGKPWTQLGFTSNPAVPVTVTARWGWTAIPAQVQQAVQLQVARWNFRRSAPAGVSGSPDQGSEVRVLERLDPDVRVSLAGLIRRRRVG